MENADYREVCRRLAQRTVTSGQIRSLSRKLAEVKAMPYEPGQLIEIDDSRECHVPAFRGVAYALFFTAVGIAAAYCFWRLIVGM